jgi:hypothetical protein
LSAFAVNDAGVGVRLHLLPESIGVDEQFAIEIDHRLHHLGE